MIEDGMARDRMEDPQILVAVHKDPAPAPSPCLSTIQVGAKLSDPIAGVRFRDDEGTNISELNPFYCELTALYWFWKNRHAPEIGLCHYRRFFAGSGLGGIATCDELRLPHPDAVIIPERRRYFVISVRDHFAAQFNSYYWEALEAAVEDTGGGVSPAFRRVAGGTSISLYNMFVMAWPLFDDYAAWLFEVLQRVQHALDIRGGAERHQRILGHMGERLMNVWLDSVGDRVDLRPRPVVVFGENPETRKAMVLLSRYLQLKAQEFGQTFLSGGGRRDARTNTRADH